MRQRLLSVLLAVATLCSTSVAHAQSATQDVNIDATVTSYCSIGGLTGTNPPADTATIPVSAVGVVTTTQITRTIASVACNNITDVTAASINGAVRTASTVTGAAWYIDYTGTATFNGATSTINTANGSAAGTETGNTASTTGAGTGNLVITIDPVQPALPLQPGSYADTLRVTLVPN